MTQFEKPPEINADGKPRSAISGTVFYIVFWEPTEKSGDRHAVHPDHIKSVKALEKDGRLLQAGPFLGEDGKPDGRGMFILRAGSAEEAHAIAQADPYYIHGYRTYRLQAWRRSEGSFTLRVNIAEGSVSLD
ncbi:MAG: YciI family protein [Beijerinckiaceae bacterium]